MDRTAFCMSVAGNGAAITTEAPLWASNRAVASPIPLEPPTTKAVFPSNIDRLRAADLRPGAVRGERRPGGRLKQLQTVGDVSSDVGEAVLLRQGGQGENAPGLLLDIRVGGESSDAAAAEDRQLEQPQHLLGVHVGQLRVRTLDVRPDETQDLAHHRGVVPERRA